MKFRTLLLGISALFIAVAAAYFSITGLSKLFAGASTAVILMASSLEFGKLISASFLYAYWDRVNKFLRTYLVMGVVVLILITSAGIYGFLTSAYQVTADQLSVIDKQTEIVELKKKRFEEQLNSANIEKERINQSINELTKGLSNNVIQYTDRSGNVVTTTSSANRNSLERQLSDAKSQRDLLSIKIETLSDSVTRFDIDVLDLQQNNEVAGEIGTLKYLAEITGYPMSNIVNWFALLIVFVFDPLAVTLVIAFNTAMKLDRSETTNAVDEKNFKIYGDNVSPKQPIDKNIAETDDTDKVKDWETTLLDDTPLILSEKDAEVFIEGITADTEPNEVLKEAAIAYKEDINIDTEDKKKDELVDDTEYINTNSNVDIVEPDVADDLIQASTKLMNYIPYSERKVKNDTADMETKKKSSIQSQFGKLKKRLYKTGD
jgi:hypothetical protein